MPSHAISLRRLRFYEAECRQLAASKYDEAERQEMLKIGEAFRQAAVELEAAVHTSAPVRQG